MIMDGGGLAGERSHWFPKAPERTSMLQPALELDLERFRDYLKILARTKIPFALRHRVDPDRLVRETLQEALDSRPEGDGPDTDPRSWLRKILGRRLADELRPSDGEASDALGTELHGSATRLMSFAGLDRAQSADEASREDLTSMFAARLGRLTEAQAEAVHLRHCEGWPIDRIGRHMGRTPVAVGGLLRHGLAALAEAMRREPGES
jgi:DNA-directed RNA polymerase specialized sigma24 family protein